jgi:hypothetical protein
MCVFFFQLTRFILSYSRFYNFSLLDPAHLIASLFIFCLIIFAISGVIEELAYLYFFPREVRPKETNDDIALATAPEGDAFFIKQKETTFDALIHKAVNGSVALQKIQPYLLLYILSFGSYFTAIFSSACMTLLYSTKHAHNAEVNQWKGRAKHIDYNEHQLRLRLMGAEQRSSQARLTTEVDAHDYIVSVQAPISESDRRNFGINPNDQI